MKSGTRKMENGTRRSRVKRAALALLLAVAFCMSLIPAGKAQAAAPKFDKKVTMRVYKSKKTTMTKYMYVQLPNYQDSITKVTSSNKKVVSVVTPTNNSFSLKPKKPGKAKVTFRYGKKKYTVSVQVKYWENPCKTFKVGKKDYAKNFNASGRYYLSKQNKDVTGKLNIVPKKGWKIKRIYVFGMGEVKNKSQITVHGGRYTYGDPSIGKYHYVRVEFYNKKTGEDTNLTLEFTPNKGKSHNVYNVGYY